MVNTPLPRREQTQKAILALDGGGMRGAFTLGFLGELESLIARETEKPNDFVLADYFDFIGNLYRCDHCHRSVIGLER
jgi:patatin-like phospholipase/acyl hydrolase